jgi:pimeloyl-ACP methyl ester carboxylesterase
MMFPMRSARLWISLIALVATIGCGDARDTVPAAQPTALAPPAPVLIHCPGIAGEMSIDRYLVKGLIQAGVAPEATIFDWTGEYSGLLALGQLDHNKRQARLLARRIVDIHRAYPRTRITLTAHSGGTGIVVWALEALPEDIKIDTLVLLASALSHGYDLDPALEHVRQAYSFHSEFDNLVLGSGTRAMGTIDRVKTDSGGYVGFDSRNPKLTQLPYNPDWIKLGNAGDHIGTMDAQFAREIISPLILDRAERQEGMKQETATR